MNSVAYIDPMEMRGRLAELGLKEEDLLLAIQRGQAARLSCTRNHPPQSSGYYAWSETVCTLRERLIPLGWERSDERNLPFTVNPEKSVAIAVATGDEATGRSDEKPCTKSSKGPRTAEAVAVNERQLELFGNLPLRPEQLAMFNECMTWLLLFHCDTEAREVRCELSRPVKMDEEGYVDDWAERVILTAFPFGGDSAKVPNIPLTDAPQSPEIVVEIKKRT